MASVEHECAACNHEDADNTIWTRCPKCGSTRVTNWHDEEEEIEDDRDY